MINGNIHSIALIQITIDAYGSTRHLRDGVTHRDDGPAVINYNGGRFWYQNGMYHREDGPAVILADGTKYWYQNGVYLGEDR